jgi:hypothetical protein
VLAATALAEVSPTADLPMVFVGFIVIGSAIVALAI